MNLDSRLQPLGDWPQPRVLPDDVARDGGRVREGALERARGWDAGRGRHRHCAPRQGEGLRVRRGGRVVKGEASHVVLTRPRCSSWATMAPSHVQRINHGMSLSGLTALSRVRYLHRRRRVSALLCLGSLMGSHVQNDV